ncbi:MAG TPA: hypothetical protein VEI81_05515 [Methanoregula sp.]|nr:hypothetical protein [Methanoregula sp.]
MNKKSIIAFAALAIFLVGIFAAGCTQDAGSSAPAASGDQSSAGGTTTPPSGDTSNSGGSNAYGNTHGHYGGGTGGNYSHGQSFMTNDTLLSAAAGNLGISETDLKEALTSTANVTSGRPNLSAAAQQLGITQQQLMDALGFPAGGFGRHTMTNTMTSPAETQSP